MVNILHFLGEGRRDYFFFLSFPDFSSNVSSTGDNRGSHTSQLLSCEYRKVTITLVPEMREGRGSGEGNFK